MRLATLILAFLLTTYLFAAENTNQTDAESEDPLLPAEIETPGDATDTDVILADVDDSDDEDTDDNGRFIPTEEISQDLGVSFPVDI